MMILLGTMAQFIGFYLLYNTSKRADLQTRIARGWAQRNAAMAKALGGAFLMASFALFAVDFSITSAIVVGTLVLMMVSTLIVVLFPLKSLK